MRPAAPDVRRIAPAGDAALVLELPARIDPAVNARAARIAAALGQRWGAILRDVVVGYATVTVYFDPLRIDAGWLETEMGAAAAEAAAAEDDDDRGTAGLIEVPVCYEADLAPDLEAVAAFARCSCEEVIARHVERAYRVYMLGFVPGFAYLGDVDERIAAPRRPDPRAAVPAGAVAIAGRQTGVYPAETPGGWNIIGRTRVAPYDPARTPSSLFRPGETVRFVRVSRERYDEG